MLLRSPLLLLLVMPARVCAAFSASPSTSIVLKGAIFSPACSSSSSFAMSIHSNAVTAELTRPLVIYGPSGVGKGTLVGKLLEKYPTKFSLSVSHTTRAPRPGEIHGEHYYFTAEAEMKQKIDQNEFLEHAQVHKHYYGTSIEAVKAVAKKNMVCVLDIDTQGVTSVKRLGSEVINPWYLFIAPPSLEVLEKRLRLRATESEDQLTTRLAEAKDCISFGTRESNSVIVNDSLAHAFLEMENRVLEWYPQLMRE